MVIDLGTFADGVVGSAPWMKRWLDITWLVKRERQDISRTSVSLNSTFTIGIFRAYEVQVNTMDAYFYFKLAMKYQVSTL